MIEIEEFLDKIDNKTHVIGSYKFYTFSSWYWDEVYPAST